MKNSCIWRRPEDLHSRRCVGFALGSHHDAELARVALYVAVAVRGNSGGNSCQVHVSAAWRRGVVVRRARLHSRLLAKCRYNQAIGQRPSRFGGSTVGEETHTLCSARCLRRQC